MEENKQEYVMKNKKKGRRLLSLSHWLLQDFQKLNNVIQELFYFYATQFPSCRFLINFDFFIIIKSNENK